MLVLTGGAGVLGRLMAEVLMFMGAASTSSRPARTNVLAGGDGVSGRFMYGMLLMFTTGGASVNGKLMAGILLTFTSVASTS